MKYQHQHHTASVANDVLHMAASTQTKKSKKSKEATAAEVDADEPSSSKKKKKKKNKKNKENSSGSTAGDAMASASAAAAAAGGAATGAGTKVSSFYFPCCVDRKAPAWGTGISVRNKGTDQSELSAQHSAAAVCVGRHVTIAGRPEHKLPFHNTNENIATCAAGSPPEFLFLFVRPVLSLKVHVEGMKVEPLKDFAAASMPAEVMKYVTVRGWKEPTLIQAHCWPVLNSGRDVIGIAETGSGKTLGFSMPAMSKIFTKMKVRASPLRSGNSSDVSIYHAWGRPCLA